MNLFGADIDFDTIPEAAVCFKDLQDEILEVQSMEGRGIGRARRSVKAAVMQFLLRCSKCERSLPSKIEVAGTNPVEMIKNPERMEWTVFKKDCKKQYDEMIGAKDAILQVLDNVW